MTNFIKPKTTPKPPVGGVLREALAGLDMLGTPVALMRAARRKAGATSPYPVMVLPGLGTNDASTAPLRYYLSQFGFNTEGWGLGLNRGGRGLIKDLSELSDRWDIDRTRPHNGEGEVPALLDRVIDRIEMRSKAAGRPIHLVGWSLGGYLAREAARDLPDHVLSVTTLGAPVLGGPKYSAVAPIYKRRNTDLDWVEQEIAKRFATPITQPITTIYSKSDGIVYWAAAMDDHSPNVHHIEVKTSHLGIGVNAGVWDHIVEALKQAEAEIKH